MFYMKLNPNRLLLYYYERKYGWWLCYIFKKKGPFWTYLKLVEKKKICLKNDGLTNNVKAQDVVWNIVAQ